MAIMPVQTKAQELYKQTFKFGHFLEYLERFYFDSVNTDHVVEQAIVNQLKVLDPHSTYISSKDVKMMNEPLQGNFEGVGISFNILQDTLYVITPVLGGPSDKLGIRPGDRIIKVDGKNIAGIGITNENVFAMLRGPKGTKVTVTVLRKYVSEQLDFTIIRDKIPINSIDAAYAVDKEIGYIKLNRFSLTTMEEFIKASTELKSKGIENLILDLTGNAGGYLDAAVSLANQFLDSGKLVVYTQGINSPRKDYYSSGHGIFENGKLVILIDEGSASASEIISGAIQDWDRGVIIGRRSFGKGLVQRQLDFSDGSVIRLTIARYFTPSGRLIQKSYLDGTDKYQNEIYDRYSHGELVNKDSIKIHDSLKFETLIRRRTVFGGGGIMPDIFVPLDTASYSNYFRDLIRKGILNRFVLQYVDENRRKLKRNYPSFNKFKTDFNISSDILDELTKYAGKEGLVYNGEDMKISGNQLLISLKAYIARDIWSVSEFYEVMNQNDNNFLKAIEVMKDWNRFTEEINR
jgi:carboxyl-terminal processing protease